MAAAGFSQDTIGACVALTRGKYTHVYTLCHALVAVGYNSTKKCWVTTNAMDHLRCCPCAPSTAGAARIAEEGAAASRARDDSREAAMFAAGQAASKSAEKPESQFAAGTEQLALAAQARFYVYSKQRISKATFNDPEWRNALHAAFEHGGGGGGRGVTMPYLTKNGLSSWLDAEYACFEQFAAYLMTLLLEYHEGNPPSQGLHDAATLKNHHKCLATGHQMTLCSESLTPRKMPELEPDAVMPPAAALAVAKKNQRASKSETTTQADDAPRMNLTLTTGMSRIHDGRDMTAAITLDQQSMKVFGRPYAKVAKSTIADAAAASVAKHFDHDPDVCEMHINDKLARAMVADLVRLLNGVTVNPFDAAQEILKTIQAIAVYFSYSTRQETMLKMASLLPAGSTALIRIEVQQNGTRVSARHGLLRSLIRMHKLVKMYGSTHGGICANLTQHILEIAIEMEAYMNITNAVAKMVQYERLYMKALGYPLIVDMLEKLRADSIDIIDCSKLTASPNLIRTAKEVSDLTEIGAECRRRVILEAERRHASNESEVCNGSRPLMDESDMLAMVMDPRTCNCEHIDADQRLEVAEEARDLLKEQYVEYGDCAYYYHMERAAAQDTAIAVVDDPDEPTAAAAPPARKRVSAFAAVNNREHEAAAAPPANDSDRAAVRHRKFLLRKHFDTAFVNYCEYCLDIDWASRFPELDLPADGSYNLVKDLMEADVAVVLDDMIRADPDRSRFGFLPYMATGGTKGAVGECLASSFCERINSEANRISTKDNVNLDDDEILKLVTIRMNRAFMLYMRTHFGHISRQQLKMTLISAQDNDTTRAPVAPNKPAPKRKRPAGAPSVLAHFQREPGLAPPPPARPTAAAAGAVATTTAAPTTPP